MDCATISCGPSTMCVSLSRSPTQTQLPAPTPRPLPLRNPRPLPHVRSARQNPHHRRLLRPSLSRRFRVLPRLRLPLRLEGMPPLPRFRSPVVALSRRPSPLPTTHLPLKPRPLNRPLTRRRGEPRPPPRRRTKKRFLKPLHLPPRNTSPLR